MSYTTIDITKSGMTAGEFFARYDMKHPSWAGKQVRLMKPYGAERDAYVIEAANTGTADAIREWLTRFDAPTATAAIPAREDAATPRQVSYITSLLAGSDLQSVYGQLFTIDGRVDTVALHSLTRRSASALISQITGR